MDTEVLIISQDIPNDDEEDVAMKEEDEEQKDTSILVVSEDDYAEDDNYSARKNFAKKTLKKASRTVAKSSIIGTKKLASNSIRKSSRSVKKPTKDRQRFVCAKCGEEFSSGWALGGHASRVHPGESDSYRRKIERREERTIERKILNMAKEKHS